MSQRYFKLLATRDGKEDWVVSEFLAGRARFGWSPPGADLRDFKKGIKPWEAWPEDIRWSWSATHFLLLRIKPGDRVVMQTRQPIREFLIGEVIEPGYQYDGGEDDFNHILQVLPLVPAPISVNSSLVPEFLKHDLSKRGRYYEIYPERSLIALGELIAKAQEPNLNLATPREEGAAHDDAREKAKSQLAKIIRDTWPSKNFERFCDDLLQNLPYVEVKERSDTFQGWDMLVQFINPITGEVLMDGVPVQCKSYEGRVDTDGPINDLERCIRNGGGSRAMLLIMGDLTESFQKRLLERAATLTKELEREITFEVVDEGRIAEIYAASLAAQMTDNRSALAEGP